MLVHKATMGVLDLYWTGNYKAVANGVPEPVMAEYDMEDGFEPDEWWEVPRNTTLGRKLRRSYPCCIPVVSEEDGSLVDIQLWPEWKRDGLEAPPESKSKLKSKEASKKQRKQRRRSKGLLEHLFSEN